MEEGKVVMVIDCVILVAHGPEVVYVTEYVPSVLAERSISPVVVLTKTNPAGDAVNVPAGDATVGTGSVPDWQKVLPP